MELLHHAANRVPGTYAKSGARFLLSDGASMAADYFDLVSVAEVRTTMAIPEVEPVVRYLNSIRSAAEPALEAEWSELLRRAAELTQSVISATGSFTITTHAGAIVAS